MAPFTAASPFALSPFWHYNETVFPCTCCSATQAMEWGTWTCVTEQREWQILDAGTPLWADLVEADIAAQRAAETPEQRAARLAADAKQEREWELDAEVSQMAGYAQMCAARNAVRVKGSREVTIRKVDRPCKWLYCDEKVSKSQWRKDENGKLCAPLRNYVTGSQCWGHEYVNPKTGRLEKPHKCAHLHPGEPGWRAEWEKNRAFSPQALSAASTAADALARARFGGGAAPAPRGGGAADGTTVWMSARPPPAPKRPTEDKSAW